MIRWVKVLLSLLGGLSVFYCVAALVFVVTTPDTGIRTILAQSQGSDSTAGVTVYGTPPRQEKIGTQSPPERGDMLFEMNGESIRNFADFSQTLVDLRNAKLDVGGEQFRGVDPDLTELGESQLTLIETDGGERYTKVRFLRKNETSPTSSWIRLQPLPVGGLMLSLFWVVPQLIIVFLSAVAFWNRPHDRALRLFFVLGFVTLAAFVGGSHWWVVAGSLWFCLPFVVAAVLLPAVLLHLFVVYPSPKSFMLVWPRTTRLAIYFVPVTFAMYLVATIVAVAGLATDLDIPGMTSPNLFATVWSSQTAVLGNWLLSLARNGILAYVSLAAVYFVLTLASLAHSAMSTRQLVERRQVQWMLFAGLVSAGFVIYATGIAFFNPVRLALGEVQAPMFLSSFPFMVAYAVGMVRYRLMLIDEVISRGMFYYVVSAALTVVYSLVIAGGSVLALRQEMSLVNQNSIAVTIALMLTIVALGWLKGRIQRVVDQEFFREKYQLNSALQGINRAVAGLVDRRSLAGQVLQSCCDVLGVKRAACYLREQDGVTFELFAQRGNPEFASRIDLEKSYWTSLLQGVSLQRLRAGDSPTQMLMRNLGVDLIHGLEVDGDLVGLIVLGPKPNAAAFTQEDGTFLSAIERFAGFALHFAKVHEDFGQIKNELERRITEVEEQDRKIGFLERQLSLQGVENPTQSEQPGDAFQAGGIVGQSPAIQQVFETVRKVAASESSVLVRGESGTGKELLARAIHDNSPRRDEPMVSLHCAALSPTLLESELFGHVRGAFTDAREDKIGRFQLADKGTLFLDEIGDISPDVQIKLLRVLQQRTFEPVGSNRTVQVDVRVIAATHRNLERLIVEGQFREDLYYRLNVISVTLPPLRERKDDILDLAMHFLAKANRRTNKHITQIDDAAIKALLDHPWPGNIRELENAIERSVVLTEGSKIMRSSLPDEVTTGRLLPRQVIDTKPNQLGFDPTVSRSFNAAASGREVKQQAERSDLMRALEAAGGNKAEAARLLGLPRSTFYSKLKKHNIA
ncbi:MAG: sigma 54-interacting transcriptional regulator [Planctomycetaceae bacterium]|nr:sigma 54-interacting transcriptional regulator [Planctomycetaceae bacterium]